MKKVMAIIGVVVLVGMYLITLFCAIFYKEGLDEWFTASAYCTVVIPVFIYAFMMLCKVFVKKDDDDSDNKEN